MKLKNKLSKEREDNLKKVKDSEVQERALADKIDQKESDFNQKLNEMQAKNQELNAKHEEIKA